MGGDGLWVDCGMIGVMAEGPTPKVVRVLPDVAAIGRSFDYAVPDAWHDDGRAAMVTVGAMVRIDLHGRRVAGWVTQIDPADRPDVELRPLAKVSGYGPAADVIDLARWTAHRWAGPVSALLGTASPPTMVTRLAAPGAPAPGELPDHATVREAFTGAGAVVRVPPLGDRWPFVLGAVAHGNALILVPSLAQARLLTGRLKQRGVRVGLHPRDWAAGRAGATMVGGRAAAFAPVEDLAAVLVIDEHDEVYQEERTPTWHARDVVIERAARAGVPCVLTSPMPTLEATERLPLITLDRETERRGWPLIRTVDPRHDGSSRGTLWTDAVVRLLHGDGRVVVVLNRKGRSKLLSCRSCDELAVCARCDAAVRQEDDGDFVCAGEGHRRPAVCTNCGATGFKNLRIGVGRAREELEALLREPVLEVTGDTDDAALGDARVLVGTEAVLHRIDTAAGVAFVDFDQELTAPRTRAGEQALALLVRAGRLVGGRRDGSGEVLVQSRQPNHPVLRAAVTADVAAWTEAERTRRRLFGHPPFAATAQISGAVAGEFVERLGTPLGIEVRGPVDGAWLVKAPDADTLADALASVERPAGRMRLAVDPLRG